MKEYKYLFNNAQNMIDLARKIQTNVYWGNSFYMKEDSIKYNYFWEYCDEALQLGYTGVTINEYEEITFIKESEVI